MIHTITDLAIQKQYPGQVDVYLDDQYGFTIDLIDAAQLQRGHRLDDNAVRRFMILAENQRAYRSALRYLSYQPRSRREIVRKLQQCGFTPDAVDDAISRLVESGYLDDHQLARRWVENRNRFKPRGKSALKFELKKKGIDDLIIEQVLADIDEGDLARRLVEKRLHLWRRLTPQAFRTKTLRYLQQRGFGQAVCFDAYRHGCKLLQSASKPMRGETSSTECPSVDE